MEMMVNGLFDFGRPLKYIALGAAYKPMLFTQGEVNPASLSIQKVEWN